MSADPRILRLIDANANRAREALRVLEDYARFVLNDSSISFDLKRLRHELAAALAELTGQAILFRDTPGDVGLDSKTDAEMTREDLSAVVTAAGKRLGEALRALGEYLKTIDASSATTIESIRYRFYDIEQHLALSLYPAKRFAAVRLCVLITQSLCKEPWLKTAEQAIAGGADCLQLREKDLDAAELLCRAEAFVSLCRQHKVISIINDRADIAFLSDADGVHVGQSDLPAKAARQIVGPNKIVGVSTHQLDQAIQAQRDGADYIGAGPVFKSPTKPQESLPGLEYLRQVARNISIPTLAISGIGPANADEVLSTGITRVAVTACVIGQDDVRAAAAELKMKLVGQTFLSVSQEHDQPPVGQTFLSVPQERDEQPVGQTFLSVSQERDQPPVGQTFLSVPRRPVSHQSDVQKSRRHLPHWTMIAATYFITFRSRTDELTMPERLRILDHLISGDQKFYTLIAAVIMPDHVHLLLEPMTGFDLSRIMKGIKGVSAKLINQMRLTSERIWQPESFDRIVRDQNELDEKMRYIVNNAAKRELVIDPWDYPALYVKQN